MSITIKDTILIDIQLLDKELISRDLLMYSKNIINKIEHFMDDIIDFSEYFVMCKIIKYMVLKNIHITNMNEFKNQIEKAKIFTNINLIQERIDIKNVYEKIYSELIKMEQNNLIFN